MNRNKAVQSERFYYIGDWVDEYCDLTLDKMVAEMKDAYGEDIVNRIPVEIPQTEEELKQQLNTLNVEEDNDGNVIGLTLMSSGVQDNVKRKSFFDKIKTFLTRRDD